MLLSEHLFIFLTSFKLILKLSWHFFLILEDETQVSAVWNQRQRCRQSETRDPGLSGLKSETQVSETQVGSLIHETQVDSETSDQVVGIGRLKPVNNQQSPVSANRNLVQS